MNSPNEEEKQISKKNQSNWFKEDRQAIGRRILQHRNQLGKSLTDIADKVDLTESLLSRIESGKVGLPLDRLEMLSAIFGCHPEEIRIGRISDDQILPLQPALEFLQQAQNLGVDGLFQDRASALEHLVPFLKKMRMGQILINGSSLRGLEQKSELEFIQSLVKLGGNPRITMKVIMTHPKIGPNREKQEGRPEGSIVNEILTGINWCVETLQIEPKNIKLSTASPSSFSIFLLAGTEGRGIINPYPTMRQAFLSYTLVVRKVPSNKGAGEAVSIFDTYLRANFNDPWDGRYITKELIEELRDCLECIKKNPKEYKDLAIYRDRIELTLKKCEAKIGKQKGIDEV